MEASGLIDEKKDLDFTENEILKQLNQISTMEIEGMKSDYHGNLNLQN